MDNRYVMEMLNRQRIDEMHRTADRERLQRMAEERPARAARTRSTAASRGGRIALDATGAGEVPGL